MILNFKSIRAKNFLSISESKIDLDNQGTVLIKGINKSPGSSDSNGSGKSTIIAEAVYYALTGETLRGTADVVNLFTGDKIVEVELEFEIDNTNYRILRTREHPEYGNNLKIWKEDRDISGDKLKKSESILKEELGLIDSSLISGILILGQGMPDTFTSLKPKERKERLEVLSQSADFITELDERLATYNKHYGDKFSSTKNTIDRKSNEITWNQNLIKRDSIRLTELEDRKNELELTANNEELNTELEELKSAIGDIAKVIQGNKESKSVLDKKIQDFQKLLYSSTATKSSKEAEKNSINRTINSLKSSKCPTCNQWISSPETIEELKKENESKLEDIQKVIDICDSKIVNCEKQISTLKSKLNEIEKTINDSNELVIAKKRRIVEIQEKTKAEIQSITEQIEVLNKSLLEYGDKIAKLDIETSSLTTLLTEYELKIGILTWLKKMATKDFRGYLLEGVKDYINSRLEYYSNALLGTNRLQMVLDGTKIYIEYDGRQYEGLSGGEKKIADLSVQFALRDMLKNTLGFMSNILVLDEVFENIDESGVKNIIELITNFNEVGSVFVISHSHLDMPHDKVITVIKDIDKTSSVEIR